MDRRYLRSSSLARKFFDDFPDAKDMPLEFMSSGQHRAYEQHVLPLLNLFNGQPSLSSCCGAVQQLVNICRQSSSVYDESRAAAEYIQSPFAISILDAAAACSASSMAASMYDTLSSQDPVALNELLYEDIRRRLVANGLQDLTASLALQFDQHPAVRAAGPHPTDLDRLLFPADAAYSRSILQALSSISLSSKAGSGPGHWAASAVAVQGAPHPQQTISSLTPASKSSPPAVAAAADAPAGAAASSAEASEGPSILKRAAWRRQLSRISSHYLAPILDRDGPGTVVLTGSMIANCIKGTNQQQQPAAADSVTVPGPLNASSSSGSSNSSSMMKISFVGYFDAAAAQDALDGCVKEVLTRWFMRHPNPLTDTQGHTLLPLAIAAQHYLLLLLPEPTQQQLPAAVHLNAAAMQAAVDHGAFEGPAAAAAADADADSVVAQPFGSGFRDVVFSFDLALHPSMEALLLSAAVAGNLELADNTAAAAAAAGVSSSGSSSSANATSSTQQPPALLLAAANALNAFAYDGDDVYTLPSAVRALASGRVLVNPADTAADITLDSAAGDMTSIQQQQQQQQQMPSAAAVMDNPALLRSLLDYNQQQQQQQQPAAGAAYQPQGPTSTAAATAAAVALSDVVKQRLIQQLRRDRGWVWGLVERPASVAAAPVMGPQQQQQQQTGSLPQHVRDAVVSRWWQGPVMSGSVLYGSVAPAQA